MNTLLPANTQASSTEAPIVSAAGLGIPSVTSPVAQGSQAILSITTSPGTSCRITVRYKSGPSKAEGLEAKTADADGKVSWTWAIGIKTTKGTWPIVINCGDQTQNTSIEVK